MGESQSQDFAALRARMVSEVDAMYAETKSETGLGAMSPAVRAALGKVERHRLVPPGQVALAYRNHPLPIGNGQTISQPYIVALSADLLQLEGGESVLDIGTGSGYQAAVLAEIVDTVYTIELVQELANSSSVRLKHLGCQNVIVRQGDGFLGWKEHAPFDAIVVTASSEEIPDPLVEQLKDGGTMVIPVGSAGSVQSLTLVRRQGKEVVKSDLLPVRFVPLLHPK